MSKDKFEECARAIWGEIEDDRLGGNYSAVPFDEVWTRGRYSHLRVWLKTRTRAVLRALREPGARIVQDCAVASAIANGCGCEYRGARVLCNSEHLPADLRSKECSCYDGAVAAIANLVDAVLAEDAA